MTDLLTGKTILITGASAGIGEHSANLFAREGANLVITARRLPELERVASAVRNAGGEVLAIRADTTNAEELDAAVKAAIDRWGEPRRCNEQRWTQPRRRAPGRGRG